MPSHHYSSYWVGLDIVVLMDKEVHLNRKLYESVSDFVQVFADHFTPCEWQHIQSASAGPDKFQRSSRSSGGGGDGGDDDEKMVLQEFYLRWAAKEAYTKALGVGLGLNFGAWQIEFYCNDDNDNNQQQQPVCLSQLWQQPDHEPDQLVRLYGRITPWHHHETSVTGTAVHHDNDNNNHDNQEIWLFLFQKLTWMPTTRTGSDDERLEQHGCACTCIGPLTNQNDSRKVNVVMQMERMTIDDLIRWHRTNHTT